MKLKFTKLNDRGGQMTTCLNEGNRYCASNRLLVLVAIKQMLRLGWALTGEEL